MSAINEAYAILSDASKRTKYNESLGDDATSASYDDFASNENDGSNAYRPEDWTIAKNVYPSLAESEKALERISPKLSALFIELLLTTKEFDDHKRLATALQDEFVQRYFGDNPKVTGLALNLLKSGNRELAKQLNQYIRVVGAKNSEQVFRHFSIEAQKAQTDSAEGELQDQFPGEWVVFRGKHRGVPYVRMSNGMVGCLDPILGRSVFDSEMEFFKHVNARVSKHRQ